LSSICGGRADTIRISPARSATELTMEPTDSNPPDRKPGPGGAAIAVRWRLHLRSAPERVYEAIASDAGRVSFLAESSRTDGGEIVLTFPNGLVHRGRVIERQPPNRFVIEYVGGTRAAFDLEDDGMGGTDLTLTDAPIAPTDEFEVRAGWVSVLMALKAAVDHGIDLRGHDPLRTWDDGYVDN
jgi:uncharacterized protein YndB with AHSA1/START domain